jgi:hypothetical protein
MKTWMLYVAAVVIVVGAWILMMHNRGPGQTAVPQQAPKTAPTVNAPVTPTAPTPTPTPAPAVPTQPAAPTPAAPAPAVKATASPETMDQAKWAEGMTAMGAISSAMRSYYIEVGPKGRIPKSLDMIGLTPGDVDGKYFGPSDYTITVESMDPLKFVVTCTAGSKADAPKTPAKKTLDSNGKWTQE